MAHVVSSEAAAVVRVGFAPIKPEYLCKSVVTDADVADVPIGNHSNEAPQQQVDGSNKRQKGMDKKRQKKMAKARHEARQSETRLCPSLLRANFECRYGEKCTSMHSIDEYMRLKPADIGDNCIIYEKTGKCPYMVTCRFAGAHTSADFKQQSKEPSADYQAVLNQQVMPMKTMRKREYDFKIADEAAAKYAKNDSDAATTSFGCMEREQVKFDMRSLRGKRYLAPLTTVGNLPFRQLCVELGGQPALKWAQLIKQLQLK